MLQKQKIEPYRPTLNNKIQLFYCTFYVGYHSRKGMAAVYYTNRIEVFSAKSNRV